MIGRYTMRTTGRGLCGVAGMMKDVKRGRSSPVRTRDAMDLRAA
jgi:hypothetical protein